MKIITGIKKIPTKVKRYFLSEEDKKRDKMGILKDVRAFEDVIKKLEKEKKRLEKEIEAVENDSSISEKDRYEKLSSLKAELSKVEVKLEAEKQSMGLRIEYSKTIESAYSMADYDDKDELLKSLEILNEAFRRKEKNYRP